MKKRSKLTELLDALRVGERENQESESRSEAPEAKQTETSEAANEENEALLELGEAFLERLDLPEGMTKAQAAREIISMWENAEKEGADGKKQVPPAAEAEEPAEKPEAKPAPVKSRLPRILRGGLGSMPEADYESMSAEQFRRLKKQLSRAALDGRRIRL